MSNQHYYNLFVQACGQTVLPELLRFKADYFASLKGEAVYCPYTGEMLTMENSDAEYIAPQTLEAIVRRFVTKEKIDYLNAQYIVNSVNMQALGDQKLAAKWAKFHWKYAKLRLVSQSDTVSYEPCDRALEWRAALRAEMQADGWIAKGSPIIKKAGVA